MPKVLIAKLDTQQRFVKNYVALMSGLMRLTDTELDILVMIVWRFYTMKSSGVPELERRVTVLSPEGRGEIRELFEEETKRPMSVQNFNNYIKSLKDKGAIIKIDDYYDINPWLYPVNQITFKYEVNEELDKYLGHE